VNRAKRSAHLLDHPAHCRAHTGQHHDHELYGPADQERRADWSSEPFGLAEAGHQEPLPTPHGQSCRACWPCRACACRTSLMRDASCASPCALAQLGSPRLRLRRNDASFRPCRHHFPCCPLPPALETDLQDPAIEASPYRAPCCFPLCVFEPHPPPTQRERFASNHQQGSPPERPHGAHQQLYQCCRARQTEKGPRLAQLRPECARRPFACPEGECGAQTVELPSPSCRVQDTRCMNNSTSVPGRREHPLLDQP